MSKLISLRSRHLFSILRNVLIITLALALVVALALSNAAADNIPVVYTYSITAGGETILLESESPDVSDVLDEAGIQINYLTAVTTQRSEDGVTYVEVSQQEAHSLLLSCDGVSYHVTPQIGETVSQLLDRLSITLDEYDVLSVDGDTLASECQEISVARYAVSTFEVVEEIAYESTRVADSTMNKGTEEVTQAGVNGSTTYTYQVLTGEDGRSSYTLIDTATVEPVDEIVTYGTYVKPVVTSTSYGSRSSSSLSRTSATITRVDTENQIIYLSDGTTYSYSEAVKCTATAYTATGNKTATGTTPSPGTVAVDPSVFPYGTKFFIVTSSGSVVYGVGTAEDCGGGIKGYRLDLYYSSASLCYAFGVRTVDAYVLN